MKNLLIIFLISFFAFAACEQNNLWDNVNGNPIGVDSGSGIGEDGSIDEKEICTDNYELIDGELISDNNCSDTEQYSVIEGDLIIKDTSDETSIDKFNVFLRLNHIKGNLVIADNDNLINLIFLKNLKSVSGNVIIKNNNLLNNITSLKYLTTIGGKIEIKGNINLATCAIERYVEQFNSLDDSNYKTIIVKDNLLDECSD